METNRPIEIDEASAALAAVRRSRARVAWAGYPAWYWFGTGAVLAVGALAMLVPSWWGLLVSAGAVVALVRITVAAGRARGVCEGWVRAAMTWREALFLYGPAIAVILAGAVATRLALWWPWPPIVAAILAFGLFTAAGRTLSARADHS